MYIYIYIYFVLTTNDISYYVIVLIYIGGKIRSDRAVSLMMTAVKWKFSEVWIAGKPVLLIAYVYAFCAPLGRFVLNMVGPKRAKAAMLGTDVYSANNLFSK